VLGDDEADGLALTDGDDEYEGEIDVVDDIDADVLAELLTDALRDALWVGLPEVLGLMDIDGDAVKEDDKESLEEVDMERVVVTLTD
jgi:hypothetical protein